MSKRWIKPPILACITVVLLMGTMMVVPMASGAGDENPVDTRASPDITVQVNAQIPTGSDIIPAWHTTVAFDLTLADYYTYPGLDKVRLMTATGGRESSEMYHEDANGDPYYDFTKIDTALDAALNAGLEPFIMIGGMPEDLTTMPGAKGDFDMNIGAADDYVKYWHYIWELFNHLKLRYGQSTVESWEYQCHVEPDNPGCWGSGLEEYKHHYDITLSAARHVCPNIVINYGNMMYHDGSFAKSVAQYTADTVNTYHPGALPRQVDHFTFSSYALPPTMSHSQMTMDPRDLATMTQQVRATVSPYIGDVAIGVDEGGILFDENNVLLWRGDGTELGAAWNAAIYKICQDENIERFAQWGHMDNGIKGPSYNVMEMYEMMRGKSRLDMSLSGTPATSGDYVDALAANDAAGNVYLLVYNYNSNRHAGGTEAVGVSLNQLQQSTQYSVEHWRVDRDHSNFFTHWLQDADARGIVFEGQGSGSLGTGGSRYDLAVSMCLSSDNGDNQYYNSKAPEYRQVDDLEMLVPENTRQTDGSGHLSMDLNMPSNSVSLIKLEPLSQVTNNPPGQPSTPSGPATGTTGVPLTFSTSATDPDGDQVKYGWDWNADGVVDEWSSLSSSGSQVSKSHSWTSAGTYSVKVRSQDEHGALGSWSAALSVSVSGAATVSGTITADPNPVVLTGGATTGTTTLTWELDGADIAQVWVSVNEGDEIIYSTTSTEKPQSGTADWIYTGYTYDFNLYAASGTDPSQRGDLVSTVRVTTTTGGSTNTAPETPTKPSGPTAVTVGESGIFISTATDPDGDRIKYGWDWEGDGTVNEWTELVSSGTQSTWSHTWTTAGTHTVKVKARDEHGSESGWSSGLSVVASEVQTNSPPTAPSTPSGPATANVGTSCVFTSTATDPDGDRIKYGWDWEGDGTVNEWTELVSSGTQSTRSHTWTTAGTYSVKIKVQDEHGSESGWSPALQVIVSSVPTATGTVTADPNPVILTGGATTGTTTLTYSWDGCTYAQLWVSINGGDEIIFSASGTGSPYSDVANWIKDGNIYDFNLYSATGTATDQKGYPLDTVRVTTETYVQPNRTPTTPSTPAGPSSALEGASCTFTTSATDPDGDQIRYGWDWQGDGVVDDWTEYVSSGTQSTWSHTWNTAGTYSVKVMAQDEPGDDSGWSPALQVTVSEVPSATGTISADPNPVIISGGSTTGTAILTWSVDGADYAQVWVDGEGFDETLFSATFTDKPYSGTADWIYKGYTYVFNLYAATGTDPSQRGELLATVEVTTETAPGETEETVVTTLTGTSQYYIGVYYSWWSINRHGQSFTAIGDSISGASVALYKYGSPSYDLTLSIRDTLKGSDLVSRTISAGSITSTSSSSPTWVTVDIPGLSVVPGNTYYLVLTGNPTDYGKFYWKANKYDPYEGGNAYISNGLSAKSTYDFLAKVSFLGAEPQMLYLADFDLDGYSNGVEEESGSDPNNYWELPNDLDMDGVADLIDPDMDNDQHSNEQEKSSGTDPSDPLNYPDSVDADMSSQDKVDVFEDSDGDGFTDSEEITAGTDPVETESSPKDDYFEYLEDDKKPQWLDDGSDDMSTIGWDGNQIAEENGSDSDGWETGMLLLVLAVLTIIILVTVIYARSHLNSRRDIASDDLLESLEHVYGNGSISREGYDEVRSDLLKMKER